MGLLGLLTFPVSAPIGGVMWIAERILEQAEHEIYDIERIQGALVELELRYDLGEFDEETFMAMEDELLARLRVARARLAAQAEEAA
jgi:hypothetical protein